MDWQIAGSTKPGATKPGAKRPARSKRSK